VLPRLLLSLLLLRLLQSLPPRLRRLLRVRLRRVGPGALPLRLLLRQLLWPQPLPSVVLDL
jgi:hypothetical protein